MPHDVFICYAERDKEVAEAICATLERDQVACWIAPRDVLPGTSYPAAIQGAIVECRLLILVLSTAANASPYVLREVEQAVSLDKPIIPFRISPDPPGPGLNFLIASRQILDATSGSRERHLARAADAVRSLLSLSEPAGRGTESHSVVGVPSPTGLTYARLHADPNVAVGESYGGYRIVRFVGSGGSGWTFQAHHPVLGTEAALKLLYPITSGLETLIEPLRNAVRALADRTIANVAHVLDFGTVALPDGSSFFLVSEFVPGVTLDAYASQPRGPLLAVAASLAETLREAHELRYIDVLGLERTGLLHGDLKPTNVIVRDDGTPILVDFLIPDIQRALDSSYRKTNDAITGVFGTPKYMAPEQLLEGQLTSASDVFALGRTFQELLRSPHASDLVRGIDARNSVKLLAAMTAARAEDRPTAAEVSRFFHLRLLERTMLFDLRVPGSNAATRPEAERPIDENVQFTVYRPRTLPAEQWCPVLAFAHLAERRPDEPGASDPVAEMERQARLVLENRDAYHDITQDSSHGIPRESDISFVLDLPGIAVNPRARHFRWAESVHREEFRIRAATGLAGHTVRGQLRVFLGSVILAEVRLAIEVGSPTALVDTNETRKDQAHVYRRIFASYSHYDLQIVRQVEHFARAFGDRYLRDLTSLRSGEVWSERIPDLIRQADVFQLFWSSHSMRSPFVRQEWEYALSLGRPYFLRPTYWEVPLPVAPDEDLPPPALLSLHFERLPLMEQSFREERFEREVDRAAESEREHQPRIPSAQRAVRGAPVARMMTIALIILSLAVALFVVFALSRGR